MGEKNKKTIRIACEKKAIKELTDLGIPITPMIIGHEMFAIFDEYSDKEIWKKADNII